MPALDTRHLSVAFDMWGCPNACRHCWLGSNRTRTMTEHDVRWAVGRFRSCVRPGEDRPLVERLTVSTHFREPDYCDEYRRSYELERELSDDPPPRYELLSVWRLARDQDYASWAKSVGTAKCQISFFGLEETTDWFCGRPGAFRDSIVATECLLEAGILPRWQFFLTRKILPELDGLMRLIDRMRLRERVAGLGGQFELFIHTPSPDGSARGIENLRPTVDEIGGIPSELVEASKRHFQKESLWHTEADLCRGILDTEEAYPCVYTAPERWWFYVTSDFDVYSNVGALEPWWCLGNLKREPVAEILSRAERNEVLGLRTICTVSAKELVREFGDLESRLVYEAASDFFALYVARYCERQYRALKSS